MKKEKEKETETEIKIGKEMGINKDIDYATGVDSYFKLKSLGLSKDQIDLFIVMTDDNYHSTTNSLKIYKSEIKYLNSWIKKCRSKKLYDEIDHLESRYNIHYYEKDISDKLESELEDDIIETEEPSTEIIDFASESITKIIEFSSEEDIKFYKKLKKNLDKRKKAIYISVGEIDTDDTELSIDEVGEIYRQGLISAVLYFIKEDRKYKINLIKKAIRKLSNMAEKFRDWSHIFNDLGKLDSSLNTPIMFNSESDLISKEDSNNRIIAAIKESKEESDIDYLIDKHIYK